MNNLTQPNRREYSPLVPAQSGAGIDVPKLQAPRRLFDALFLRPSFMVGRIGALRSAVSCSGNVNPICPATLLIDVIGGSSQIQEGSTMNGLITVSSRTFSGTPTPAINARDLCTFLCKSHRFDMWITRRIEDYGFVHGDDYLTQQVKTGGRPRTDYYLTLDMAKELAMVERNEKGRQARQYFIKCEKQLKQPALPLAGPQRLLLTMEGSKVVDSHPISDDMLLVKEVAIKALLEQIDALIAAAASASQAKYQVLRDNHNLRHLKTDEPPQYQASQNVIGSPSRDQAVKLALFVHSQLSEDNQAAFLSRVNELTGATS